MDVVRNDMQIVGVRAENADSLLNSDSDSEYFINNIYKRRSKYIKVK